MQIDGPSQPTLRLRARYTQQRPCIVVHHRTLPLTRVGTLVQTNGPSQYPASGGPPPGMVEDKPAIP
jgi:hypothetical protein